MATNRQVNPDLYPWAEKDWPALLHVMISVRPSCGTHAWLNYADTTPTIRTDTLKRVDYRSDSRSRSPEAVIEVLQTMIKQLQRQLELARALRQ